MQQHAKRPMAQMSLPAEVNAFTDCSRATSTREASALNRAQRRDLFFRSTADGRLFIHLMYGHRYYSAHDEDFLPYRRLALAKVIVERIASQVASRRAAKKSAWHTSRMRKDWSTHSLTATLT